MPKKKIGNNIFHQRMSKVEIAGWLKKHPNAGQVMIPPSAIIAGATEIRVEPTTKIENSNEEDPQKEPNAQ